MQEITFREVRHCPIGLAFLFARDGEMPHHADMAIEAAFAQIGGAL